MAVYPLYKIIRDAFPQQKSVNKGRERYLILGPNQLGEGMVDVTLIRKISVSDFLKTLSLAASYTNITNMNN